MINTRRGMVVAALKSYEVAWSCPVQDPSPDAENPTSYAFGLKLGSNEMTTIASRL